MIFVVIQIPAKGVAGWDHTVIRTPGRCKKAQVSVFKAVKLFGAKYKYKYRSGLSKPSSYFKTTWNHGFRRAIYRHG